MTELVIEKRHNPVMDLCIAYGLYQLIASSKVDVKLQGYPSAYVITYDTFDVDDVDLFLPDDFVNFGRFLNKERKEKMLQKILGDDANESLLLVDGALESILDYYQMPVGERVMTGIPKHASKKDLTSIIGTWYGGKGHRTSGAATTGYRVHVFERLLAELGFVFAVSFTSINKEDYLFWVGVPSESGITELRLFDNKKIDKDTGEIKRNQFIAPHSVEIGLAQTHLNVQHKMQKANIQHEYDGALFMRGWFNGNTGSPDWVDHMAPHPFRESTLQAMLNHMSIHPRDKKVSFQHALSTWLVHQQPQGFYDTAAIIAKEDRWVGPEESEDILKMAGLSQLHTNIGVNRIGRRLNELLYNKRGYTVMLEFMDVDTKEDLMRALSNMAVEYDKLNKGRYPIWNQEEFEAFIKEVDNPDVSGQAIASAVLLLSKTKHEKKVEAE